MTTEKEKLNMIGKLLADIQMDIKFLRQEQKLLREYITNPDRVKAERTIKELS